MPYKSEKIIIAHTQFDRRIKLSIEDKEEICRLHKEENVGIRELTRRYKVSHRSIQFIIYPERQAENILRRNERGGSKQYYKKEKGTKAIAKTRNYKQKLFIAGKVSLPDK